MRQRNRRDGGERQGQSVDHRDRQFSETAAHKRIAPEELTKLSTENTRLSKSLRMRRLTPLRKPLNIKPLNIVPYGHAVTVSTQMTQGQAASVSQAGWLISVADALLGSPRARQHGLDEHCEYCNESNESIRHASVFSF